MQIIVTRGRGWAWCLLFLLVLWDWVCNYLKWTLIRSSSQRLGIGTVASPTSESLSICLRRAVSSNKLPSMSLYIYPVSWSSRKQLKLASSGRERHLCRGWWMSQTLRQWASITWQTRKHVQHRSCQEDLTHRPTQGSQSMALPRLLCTFMATQRTCTQVMTLLWKCRLSLGAMCLLWNIQAMASIPKSQHLRS